MFWTKLIPLVVLIYLAVVFWTMFLVGRARGRTGIRAPATTGHPDLERALRVQMNTVEQSVLFLPALWLSAQYGRPDVTVIAGAVWLIGRVVFGVAYLSDPAKRGPGFMVGMLGFAALSLSGAWGVLRTLI